MLESHHLMTLRTDVTLVDAVMDELSDPAESQCELLGEHLESARTYLLGGMREEYILSLRLADDAVSCISNAERRSRVKRMIADLLADGG